MVIMIAGLGVMMTGCSSGGPTEPVAESNQVPTTTLSPYKTNGDGQVAVVEKGFSLIKDGILSRYSYGAVLENRNRAAVAFPV